MAQNKKKNFWYVIVMSNNGPVFVTKINYQDKTAQWNKTEKPLELGKYEAQDLCLGLSLNFHMAFAVCVPYEIESQPYRYDAGQFEWTWNDKEKEKEKEKEEK